MKKLKLISITIVLLLISIFFIYNKIESNDNQIKLILENTNSVKSSIQEISKEVFYIYKKNNISISYLTNNIDILLININKIPNQQIQNKAKQFLSLIKQFQKNLTLNRAYINITLENNLKDIYNLNLNLVNNINQFNKQINTHCVSSIKYLKTILNILLFILFVLFIFLIKYLTQISNNFDILVKKINNTIKSIDQIQNQTEDILDSNEFDTNRYPSLSKKEDAIIEALDELIYTKNKLQYLQKNIDDLKKLKSY
jgi:hypothetical protein